MQYVDGASARFAYRRLGPRSGVPLIMAHRFRGTARCAQLRIGGETMLAGLQLAFADKVAARPTLPTGTLTVGTQTLAGVPFEIPGAAGDRVRGPAAVRKAR